MNSFLDSLTNCCYSFQQQLLDELLAAKQIRAKSKWKEVYPLFSKDERYLNLLGNPGSNPIELFWDVVDILDEALEHHAARVEKVFTAKQMTFTTEMTEEEFLDLLKGEPEVEQLNEGQLKNVYQHVSLIFFRPRYVLTATSSLVRRSATQKGGR